jgi:hypothetical protein
MKNIDLRLTEYRRERNIPKIITVKESHYEKGRIG